MICQAFEVWYYSDHVRKLLHQLGFSPQMPDGRAAERNELRTLAWREQVAQVAPELEKKVTDGAPLVDLDEVGFALKGVRRQTWAPRGEPPLVTFPENWSKRSTIGAITSDGRFFQNTQQGVICSPDVIRFLSHLLDHVVGALVVVLDNAGSHRSKAVQTFMAFHGRLALIYFPPYAPELNPIELVWAYIKRNVWGNGCLRTVKERRVQRVKAWQRVRSIRLPQPLMDANLRRDQ